MNKAFLITSCIEPSDSALTYSQTRSVFTVEQRLEQTLHTLDCVTNLTNGSDRIYLLDSSRTITQFDQIKQQYPNIVFVSVKQQFPQIHHEATHHANKSRCETLITSNFLNRFRSDLIQQDLMIKLSGRYCVEGTFDNSSLDSDHMFFKKPLEFAWQDWWNYDMVRSEQEPSILKQYCSVAFAWGRTHFDKMLNIYEHMSNLLINPNMQHYDMETLLYFLTRPYQNQIIETDWIVSGHLGASGLYVRY